MRLVLLTLALILAIGCEAFAQRGVRIEGRKPPISGTRVALVIGNSGYQNISRLRNPVNDARAIGKILRENGFQVTALLDADRRDMLRAVQDFGRKLRSGGVGLFYFAGHGVQARGRNYLIPLGARVEGEADLEFEAVDAGRVLAKMENAQNQLNIVILDACRNNPYGGAFRSARNGLAQVSAPTGSLVAYATAPGKVAADGDGRNGLYTEQLIRHMRTPGLKLEDVFKRVRIDVQRLSGGKQVPWENTSVTGDFYFSGQGDAGTSVAAAPVAPMTAPRPGPTLDEEEEFWKVIKDSNDAGEFKAFLKEFPDSRFSAVARIKLKRLERQAIPRPRSVRTIRLGTYTVLGANPNGSTYSGTLTMRRSGNTYHLRWKIGNQVYSGVGALKNSTLTVDWGDKYPVIYQVQANGVLKGRWANGKARETLTFYGSD